LPFSVSEISLGFKTSLKLTYLKIPTTSLIKRCRDACVHWSFSDSKRPFSVSSISSFWRTRKPVNYEEVSENDPGRKTLGEFPGGIGDQTSCFG